MAHSATAQLGMARLQYSFVVHRRLRQVDHHANYQVCRRG